MSGFSIKKRAGRPLSLAGASCGGQPSLSCAAIVGVFRWKNWLVSRNSLLRAKAENRRKSIRRNG